MMKRSKTESARSNGINTGGGEGGVLVMAGGRPKGSYLWLPDASRVGDAPEKTAREWLGRLSVQG